MQGILEFLSSPVNVSYIALIVLGILFVAYGVVGREIEKRKTIINNITKKKRSFRFFDKLLDKSKFIKKREAEFTKQTAVLDMKYSVRTFTKMKMLSGGVGIALSIYLQNILAAIPLVLICMGIPSLFIEMRVKRRVALFNDQILEAFQIFITEYTTTKSVQKTIVNICPKLKNPLRKEFERLGRKLNSGEPVEEVFVDFAERTQNKWTLVFSQMMITYYRNGGDFTEQLLNITKSITDEKILEEANSMELTSLRIVNIGMNVLVPIAYISNKFINPKDARVFIDTATGRNIMFGIVLASFLSLYLGKKITDA